MLQEELEFLQLLLEEFKSKEKPGNLLLNSINHILDCLAIDPRIKNAQIHSRP